MLLISAYELSSIGNFMVVHCFFLFMENTVCFRQLVFQPLQLFHFIFFKLTTGVTCYTHDVTSEWAIFGIDLDFTVYIHNVPFFLCVCVFFNQIKNFLLLLWVNLYMISGIYLRESPPFNGPFFMTPPFCESRKVVTLPLFPPPLISGKSLLHQIFSGQIRCKKK